MQLAPLHPSDSLKRSINLLSLSFSAGEQLIQDFGWPRYRTAQLFRWLYRRRVRSIDEMTDFSQAARRQLQQLAKISRFEQVQVRRSSDGTRKFVIRLEHGVSIESVLIPDAGRLTLCLSTQVGCTLDCRFCLTGTMGLKRNLEAHEIVDQVLTVQDHLDPGERLSSLVFMGMGEPLANFDAVRNAIEKITDAHWGLSVPARRITLSTAGLASRIQEVAALGVNLAISLNATTNEQRDRLMPTANRLHSLDRLLAACREYPLAPHRRLTFEYVLLAGMNDTGQDAKRLVKLLNGIRCKINLIPFNEFPGNGFRRPDDAVVQQFQSVLRRGGFAVFVRKSKGRDVLGACGQLGELPQDESVLLTPVAAHC